MREIALFLMSMLMTIGVYADAVAERLHERFKYSLVRFSDFEGHVGSGFAVDARGIVATNRHVVDSLFPQTLEAWVKKADGSFVQRVVKHSRWMEHPTYDLVLLKIVLENGESLAPLLNSAVVPMGNRVCAIGHPGAEDTVLVDSITTGLSQGYVIIDDLTYLQFSSAVNPGNSGGPLLTVDGTVAGIVTMKIVNKRRVAYAIPGRFLQRQYLVPAGSVEPPLADLSMKRELAGELLQFHFHRRGIESEMAAAFAASLYRDIIVYRRDWATLFEASRAFHATGADQAAEFTLRMAEEAHPDGAEILEMRARLAWTTGDQAAAARMWRAGIAHMATDQVRGSQCANNYAAYLSAAGNHRGAAYLRYWAFVQAPKAVEIGQHSDLVYAALAKLTGAEYDWLLAQNYFSFELLDAFIDGTALTRFAVEDNPFK